MENLFFEEKLLPALEKKGYRSYICKRMNSSGNKQVKKKKKKTACNILQYDVKYYKEKTQQNFHKHSNRELHP